MKWYKFRDHLKEALKNKNVRKAFEEEDVYARLALQIAELRDEKGWSREDFAKKLRISQRALTRIEYLDGSLSIDTLVKLAQAFHKHLKIRFV